MPTFPWIEFPLSGLAVVGPLLLTWWRFHYRKTTTKKDGSTEDRPMGIGVRIIQLIGLFLIVPLVAILSLEGKLSGEGTGTILGAVVGYALSGIREPIPSAD
jgi:hypothetical protein